MREHVALNTNGTMSLIQPGSTPLLNSVVPPSRHARSNRSRTSGSAAGGWQNGTSEVVTTFLPAWRHRAMSSAASRYR